MAQTTFEDRLKKLDAKAATPKAPSPRPAPIRKRPTFLATGLIGIVFLVVGVAGAFVVLMLRAGVASLVTRLRRPILNRIALFTLAGYGITSTLLRQVIT